MKQYFIKDSIFSSTKKQVVEYMKDNNLSEITVFEAKKIKVNDFFYCKINGMGYRDDMTCGSKWCVDYVPRNGKSGCCKNTGNLYEKGKHVTFYNNA